MKDKVVLITGASRGIGAAMAKEIAKTGAKVIVNYAGSKQAAEDLAKEIGGLAIQADVSKTKDVQELFDQAIARYGRIDVLINNAGIMTTKLIKDTTDEDFDRQFAINVKGTFNTMREAATRLADNGVVINFSTSVKRLMVPTYGTYAATKGAVEELTRVFSREVAARGIRVNSVSPGPTSTELYLTGKTPETIARQAALSPFNRIGQPEEIAKVILFLISDEAAWIDAQNIGINGGMA